MSTSGRDLVTARLQLRPWGPADLDDARLLLSHPDVRRFLCDDRVLSGEEVIGILHRSDAEFARFGFGLWAVFRGKADLAGFCGLRTCDYSDDPELLYGLHPAWWRQGIATEAASAVLGFAFDALGLPRVAAATDVPNVASARVLERIGMRLVRRDLLHGLDTIFYELWRDDWRAAGRRITG